MAILRLPPRGRSIGAVRPLVVLECTECGQESEEHVMGWRAYLTVEDDGSEAVLVFCPECAEREFGDG